MAGLQDIAPMVAKRWVTKAVFAPIRAAALAASQPAWPAPITMTSKKSAREIMPRLLSRSWKTRKEEIAEVVSRETMAPGTDQNVSRETSRHSLGSITYLHRTR